MPVTPVQQPLRQPATQGLNFLGAGTPALAVQADGASAIHRSGSTSQTGNPILLAGQTTGAQPPPAAGATGGGGASANNLAVRNTQQSLRTGGSGTGNRLRYPTSQPSIRGSGVTTFNGIRSAANKATKMASAPIPVAVQAAEASKAIARGPIARPPAGGKSGLGVR